MLKKLMSKTWDFLHFFWQKYGSKFDERKKDSL